MEPFEDSEVTPEVMQALADMYDDEDEYSELEETETPEDDFNEDIELDEIEETEELPYYESGEESDLP